MSVRIRLKRMGRRHRPYYRICAMDTRSPRDGRVLEELGTYDPMIRDTDARTTLVDDRVTYWLGVGAKPTGKVSVLIKKYGPEGTHKDQADAARAKLKAPKVVPPAPKPVFTKPTDEPAAEAPAAETAEAEAAETASAEASEAPAEAEAPGEETQPEGGE